MDKQRIQLLAGFSIIGAIITYAIYRTLFSQKRDAVKQPNEDVQSSCDDESLQISPPMEFSSKFVEQREGDRSHEIIGEDNALAQEEGDTYSFDSEDQPEVVEDIIAASANTTQASIPVVNLDETVSLHSSDLSSGNLTDDSLLEDSDIIEVKVIDDSVIADLVSETEQLEQSIDLLAAVLDKAENGEASVVVPSVTYVTESEAGLSHDSLTSQMENSASSFPEVDITEPLFAKEPNAASDELELRKEMPKYHETAKLPHTTQSVDILEPKITCEHIVSSNNSHTSEDSVNACVSITTDSGIGLTNSTSAEGHASKAPSQTSSTGLDTLDGVAMAATPSRDLPMEHKSDLDEKPTNMFATMPAAAAEMDSSVAADSMASPKPSAEVDQDCENGTASASVTQNGGVGSYKKVVHKFLMPESLCGIFIGRGGRNITALKHRTNTNIKIGREPVLSAFRYCTIEGNDVNVHKALRLIKKQYPDVDTTHVDHLVPPPPTLALPMHTMQPQLPMGVLLDVVVCHIVNAGHVFVQQPAHPAFNSWQRLDGVMNACYQDGSEAPVLPPNTDDGVLCVVRLNDRWYRAQILSFSDDQSSSEIRLVDVGGYVTIETNSLRQIREDFLSVPFQAAECYLANIRPLDGETFSTEAEEALTALTSGQMVQCQPAAADVNHIPYVHVIAQQNKQAVVVNQELVSRGLVAWCDMSA